MFQSGFFVWSIQKERPIGYSDSFEEFERWVHLVERSVPVEILIDVVSARLTTAANEDYYRLARMLESFLSTAGRDREALELLDELIERYPDDVRTPISRSVRLLYLSEDPEAALQSIDVAVGRAYRTGLFRREALGYKARILLKLGRRQELSGILEEIMSLKITKGIPDIGRERDFIDRAPPGMIPSDVLARYNEFRPKRPTDTTADEPPEWESPEEAE